MPKKYRQLDSHASAKAKPGTSTGNYPRSPGGTAQEADMPGGAGITAGAGGLKGGGTNNAAWAPPTGKGLPPALPKTSTGKSNIKSIPAPTKTKPSPNIKMGGVDPATGRNIIHWRNPKTGKVTQHLAAPAKAPKIHKPAYKKQ